MSPKRATMILRGACFFALASLGLMVWSLFDPRPLPVVIAMSVGQVLGTCSLGAFLFVVFLDLRRANAAKSSGAPVEKAAVVNEEIKSTV